MSKEITFADIQNANASIKTTPIQGKEYAEVNQRIKAFRSIFPTGSITTDLISNINGIAVFKATVTDESGKVLATGTAYEKEGNSFINKTSYIENCETSAVGRALGMCGFGIDVSLASADEIQNAQANHSRQNTNSGKSATSTAQAQAVYPPDYVPMEDADRMEFLNYLNGVGISYDPSKESKEVSDIKFFFISQLYNFKVDFPALLQFCKVSGNSMNNISNDLLAKALASKKKKA